MSITDGTFICGLCGEWQTGCGLCSEAPLIDMRTEMRRADAQARADDFELRQQEKSIRKAAEARRGEQW